VRNRRKEMEWERGREGAGKRGGIEERRVCPMSVTSS
jgi:hypothetical protein